ncbi:MPN domain-containing protein CG4751 [Phlebotomus argentipes]|uniref:MPN domain-containing protein CG4751 n=1 Tax=Phlebotomus argentipes TaxID=94469 RepID=UPI0028931271|nr:MPN domain-containing protein CG4751 [Phlebotomus argentipes]
MSTKGDEETEKDAEKHLDSDIGEENEKEGETRSLVPFSNSNGAVLGRTVTLQMLLAAKILQPGKSAMTIEYLGQKFVGDLLPDGKIKSQETETVFCSPSAWAIHCKRIINPDKKSGCGWASVKYKGKKLDAYKAAWVRKCQLNRGTSPSGDAEAEPEKKEEAPEPIKRIPVSFNTISDRNIAHDGNTLVEVAPFSLLGRPQPFMVSVATSAVLLLDFHCHLTSREVCGYLGGSWDPQAQRLYITHTFPCRNSRHDREKSGDVEISIQKMMLEKNVSLVGWYHSHPKCGAQPTLRDCDAQMDYEIRMRGPTDATYAPIIGIICSPYNEDNPAMESSLMMYWVVPPPENKLTEYGRPMQMTYSVMQDEELAEEVKSEMLQCVEYYKQFDNELVRFGDIYRDDVTYIEKMKVTLYPKFARKQENREFWNWVRKNVGLEEEEEFAVPKTVIDQMLEKHTEMLMRREAENKAKDDEKNSHEDGKTEEMKEEEVSLNATDKTEMDAKGNAKLDDKQTPLLSQISSLQEQLNLPSGLNMNPSALATALVIPHVATNSNMSSNASSATNTNSSPRDSPITIPSSSASPAKFEIPIRASPSPAKSDASSSRTRNSPAQSPAKFNVNDVLRNSPCRTPNNQQAPPVPTHSAPTASLRHDNPPPGTSSLKYDGGGPAAAAANMNELFAASLAQLAKTLPPGLLTNDYAALFQQTPVKMANDYYSMAAAAAAAAALGNGKGSSNSRSNSNLKDLMTQFNKNDLNYMMQSQYNPMMGMTPSRQETKTSTTSTTSSRSNSKSSRSGQSARTSKYIDSQAIPASSKSQQQQQQRLAAGYESLRAAEANRQLADFMKSTEYASLLLQQSGALGFNPAPAPTTTTSGKKSRSKAHSQASTPQMPSMADLSTLLQATSKIPDLSSFFATAGAGKQPDFSQFLQQTVTPPVTSMSSSSAASRKAAADLSSFYGSKLPDLTTITPVSMPSTNAANSLSSLPQLPSMADFSALFAPVLGAGSSSKKGSSNSMPTNDMLGTLLQAGKMNDINSLLFPASNGSGGKMGNLPNLSSYFSTPMGTGKSDAMSLYPNISATATTSTASSSRRQKQEQRQQEQRQQEQDLAALYQHMKYPGLPDPLSKSTLAANNMYMSPSAALLKMQQEALSAMMMKPPKSTSASSSTSSAATSKTPDILSIPPSMSPIPERLLTATPSKSSASSSSSRGNSPLMPPNPTKYNFSAVDLAISAVPSPSAQPIRTPPASSPLAATDLSAKKFYSPANSYGGGTPVKKRMEFSSIADLVAPPPTKMQKMDETGLSDADDSGILNLSSNCK